ncbi:PilZ domain-containing protein [Sporolactobacillus shoreae]|uniref:PilZ domain-containing protein n=1 Tax=Sporolactobacillus shoreae TaxID=1465501 RepID=A0A4Z0GLV7_9BACL|nr:PilZ domain-containing protein [Sporolactobacillus shoreae]TGA97991.1 PilZ domain-containing protein [Sporolactobacillus shoreae]
MSPFLQIAGLIGLVILTILVVGTIFYFYYRHVLQSKQKKISELKNNVNQDQNIIAVLKERRKFRRVPLNHEKCTIKVIDFKEENLQALNNKTLDGEVMDISVGGLKFTCDIDFPIRNRVHVEVIFESHNFSFDLSGNVLRKEEKSGDTHVHYGVQFKDLSAADETQIQSLINAIDLEERRTAFNKSLT